MRIVLDQAFVAAGFSWLSCWSSLAPLSSFYSERNGLVPASRRRTRTPLPENLSDIDGNLQPTAILQARYWLKSFLNRENRSNLSYDWSHQDTVHFFYSEVRPMQSTAFTLVQQMSNAVIHNPHLKQRQVHFNNDNGRVTIQGSVESYFEKQMAQEAFCEKLKALNQLKTSLR